MALFTGTPDVRLRQDHQAIRSPTSSPPSAGSPRSRPTTRWPSTASSLSELGRIAEPAARRTPQQLEAVFALDRQCARTAQEPDRAVHRARERAASKIENQLWSALFDLTQAFLVAYYAFAREVSHHAQSAQVAAAAARAALPAGRAPGPRREDPAVPLRAVDPGEVGGAARAVLARLLAPVRARSSCRSAPAAARRRSSTSTCWCWCCSSMHAGNMTAQPSRVGRAASSTNGAQPLRFSLEPSSVTSFYVDLGARDGLRRRTPAPLEGRVLFLDTRPLHALLHAERRRCSSRRSRRQPLSDRTPKRTEQLAPADQARVAGGSRVQAVRPPRRAHGRGRDRRCDRRLRATSRATCARRSAIRSTDADSGKSFGGTMELAVFGRMRNEPDRTHEPARRRFAHIRGPRRAVGGEGRERRPASG